MTGTDVWLLVTASGFVVLAAVSFVPVVQRVGLMWLVRWTDLDYPDALDPWVRRRYGRQQRWASVAALVALLAFWLPLRLGGAPVPGDYPLVCAAFALIGGTLGASAGGLVSETRRPASPVRLARASVLTVGDYLPRVGRVMVWVVSTGVFAGLVGALVLVRPGLATGVPIAVIAAAVLLSVILYEFGSRAILRHPQPASTEQDLLWNDVLRLSVLRDLLGAPIQVALAGSYALAFLGEANAAVIAIRFVILGLVFAFVIPWRNSRRHVLEKLWSNSVLHPPATLGAQLAPTPNQVAPSEATVTR